MPLVARFLAATLALGTAMAPAQAQQAASGTVGELSPTVQTAVDDYIQEAQALRRQQQATAASRLRLLQALDTEPQYQERAAIRLAPLDTGSTMSSRIETDALRDLRSRISQRRQAEAQRAQLQPAENVTAATISSLAGTPSAVAFNAGDPLSTCDFRQRLPTDSFVELLGVYEGRQTPTRMLGNSDTQRVDVFVQRTDRPTFLLLSGFDSVEWRILTAPGARLAGVAAVGRQEAVVTGVPANVPMVWSSGQRQDPACTQRGVTAFNAWRVETHLVGADAVAEALTGRRADNVQMTYGADRFVVGGRQPTGTEFASPDRGDVYSTQADIVLPKGEGIEQLLGQGVLRRSTLADREEYAASLAKLAMPVDRFGNAQKMPALPSRAYVITRATRLPPGLCGAHSVDFYLPPNVPPPVGDRCHSTLYVWGECPASPMREGCGTRE